MAVKQLSVFVENKFGRAYQIINVLSKNKININALCVADTSEYGIMRLIVDKPEEAMNVLKESGVMVKITDVLAVPMETEAGSLSKLLKIMTDSRISIEYMYAFTDSEKSAVLVLKTDNNDYALKQLTECGIKCF